jgi:hypothetical protein
VVRKLVSRRSRARRWVALAAALVVALGALALLASRDDGATAEVADALGDVPTSIKDWSELDSSLVGLAAADALVDGEDVQLVRAANADGSIAFSAPSTWTDVEGTLTFNDVDGTVLGDLLVVSPQRSGFDGGRAGGLFVGAAPITSLAPNGLDDFQPRQFFSDLGCVSSDLIQLEDPFGGEARLWSDCNNTPRIYVSALFGDSQVTIFVFGLVTTRQEAAVLAETLMSLEIEGTPLA